MWDHEGVLRDLRALADDACAGEVLAGCTSLLNLPPVRDVVACLGHPLLRAYVLRGFLRSVVNRADVDDITVKAAGALIGVELSYAPKKELRQDAAGVVLDRTRRTVRRPGKQTELLEGLAAAITDFTRDSEATSNFVKAQQAWLESRASTATTPDVTLEEASPQVPDPPIREPFLREPTAARKRPSSPSHEAFNVADVLSGLSAAAKVDPVAKELVVQIQSVNLEDKQWLGRIEILYRLQLHASELGDRLLAAAQARRVRREKKAAQRFAHAYESDALSIYTVLLLLHAGLSIFIMREGYRWLSGGSDIERRARESLHAVYRYAPYKTEDNTWLTQLLSWPEPGHELDSVLRGRDTPNMPGGREVEEDWLRFLANCHCKSDNQPDEGCLVHALIGACAQLSQDLQALAIYQLTTPLASEVE
jgi:hypothetical protein